MPRARSTTGQQPADDLAHGVALAPDHAAQVIADDRVAQRRHRHEQRRGRDSLVHVLRARVGAALDAVDVVAHDFADRCEPRRFAGQHDPGREPPGPAAVERVEHDVDEVAELALARAQAHHRRFDRGRQLAHHLAHQLGLQAGRRAEVMNEIGVTHPEVGRHGLQRDRIRSVGQQQAARGRERQGARFLRCTSDATGIAVFCDRFRLRHY